MYIQMSTVADIVITLCYVFTLNMFVLFGFVGRYVVIFLGIFLTTLTLYVLRGCIHDRGFVKTIKESLLTLVLVAFIVNVTGTILKGISGIVGSRKEQDANYKCRARLFFLFCRPVSSFHHAEQV